MSESFLSASSFAVPKCENRAAGAGFLSALIRYVAAWVAASAKGIPGIVVFTGNNLIVSAIHSVIVLVNV